MTDEGLVVHCRHCWRLEIHSATLLRVPLSRDHTLEIRVYGPRPLPADYANGILAYVGRLVTVEPGAAVRAGGEPTYGPRGAPAARLGMTMSTGSNSMMANWVDGVLTIPCRCGTAHTGGDAREDWRHHNCLHDGDLVDISPPHEGTCQQVLCMDCGRAWGIRKPGAAGRAEGEPTQRPSGAASGGGTA